MSVVAGSKCTTRRRAGKEQSQVEGLALDGGMLGRGRECPCKTIGIAAALLAISGLLWAATDPATLSDPQPRPEGGLLRVISYNVLEGFKNAPQRREQVIAWLKAQGPDVVALQELNGYSEEQLLADARQWGHEYAVLLKRNGYPTGLTSRTPISAVERVLEGYHHGTIHARTADLDFIVAHLSPLDYRVRRAEAQQIADWVGRLTKAGREVIVLGDLNSTSPLDQERYEASGNARAPAQGGRAIGREP